MQVLTSSILGQRKGLKSTKQLSKMASVSIFKSQTALSLHFHQRNSVAIKKTEPKQKEKKTTKNNNNNLKKHSLPSYFSGGEIDQ